MPHSLSTWSVRSTFWSPEEGICSGSPWDISTDKNIFLDVNIPDVVFVNEQVQLKVLVHADSTTSTKVVRLRLCLASWFKLAAILLGFSMICARKSLLKCVSLGVSPKIQGNP